MSETEKVKKFRSPPYPAIDLAKAVERTRQLYAKAQGFEVGFKVLADAWSYGEKSSGLWGTAAALIHYGLLEDQGTGKSRKFKISDTAHRIIRDADENSEKRREAIKRAALSPAIFSDIWEKFENAKDLADGVIINYLTLDRKDEGKAPFSDAAAEDCLSTYRDTIAFARLSDASSVPQMEVDATDEIPEHIDVETSIQIGDYIHWSPGGVDQFKPPRKVVWISDDGTHLRVHGSPTGIPVEEAVLAEAPAPSPAGAANSDVRTGSEDNSDISVYLEGQRLQITANVDAKGVDRLKKMLEKYEEILKLLE